MDVNKIKRSRITQQHVSNMSDHNDDLLIVKDDNLSRQPVLRCCSLELSRLMPDLS
jgi:hypothetical protein